ncbi:Protein CBG15405 [Caenorhabditis briggsae]|uniref:Protein CBG15405 n=1 Tax=Caenorhabditis briggsae TaxID=6238 RepID=A8XMC6_CAEBR|nr:Protein CBG15405 [Caenorhabditis briggsae]CAP33801.2 Protein CBG15405 [Caenorhabditis briggsae]
MNETPVVDIVTKNQLREDFVDIKEHENTEKYYFQLKVFGKIIDFRRHHFLEAAFNPDESESVIKSIHNYMVHFFGDSMEYLWLTSDCMNPIPQLQNISSCIRVWHVNPDSIDLENFFSTSPPFKKIEFNVFRPTDFSPDSNFYQAESVVTVQHHNTFPSVLRHFQGKQAFVDCTYHNTEDLIELVKRWKSGEAFQKLEVLNFNVSEDDIDQDIVLNGIGAKYIDARKTPPTHTLPRM